MKDSLIQINFHIRSRFRIWISAETFGTRCQYWTITRISLQKPTGLQPGGVTSRAGQKLAVSLALL